MNKLTEYNHEYYMNQALKEAQKASEKGEVPVGAVIVSHGKIIARGHNQKEFRTDATEHAEMSAIRKASKKLGTWRLNECDVYVTLEPCTMCAGALIQARIRRLYIAAPDPKTGAAGSVLDVFAMEKFNHRVEVHFGILQNECSGILKNFFKMLRDRK